MNGDLAELRSKVLRFLEAQPGFELYKNEKLETFREDPKYLGVVFGDNVQAGIAGFGEDVDKTYKHFVRSWKQFNGFEWQKKNKR